MPGTRNRAHDVSQYTFSGGEVILIDANVWLHLYPAPSDRRRQYVVEYSQALKSMLSAGVEAVLSHKRRVRMGLNRALSYDWFSHKANDGKEIQTHGAQWYRTRTVPQAGVET